MSDDTTPQPPDDAEAATPPPTPPTDDAAAPPPTDDAATPPPTDDAAALPPADGDAAGAAPPPPPPPFDDGTAGTSPPPPGGEAPGWASAPSARPLLRRDHDKHLAGVAGGLADYFGIDTGIMRVAFVILALFGVGLPLYLVGWLAMPSPAMPQSYVEKWFGRSPNPVALLAVVAGIIVLLAVTGGHRGGSAFGWGLALLFGGWLLFRADSRAAIAGGAPPPPPPPVLGPPSPAGAPVWHGAGGTTAPTYTWTPPPPKPPKPPSILGRLTVGLGLAAVGLAALLEQFGVLSLDGTQYVALGLTIVGIGLIVGAWVGRAYGLIAIGIPLIPLLFVLSVGPMPYRGGAGDFSYVPQTVEELQPIYRLGAGELAIDMSAIDFSGETAAVDVSVGLGETTIIVPQDVTVTVDADMRAGEMIIFGQQTTGQPFEGPVSVTSEGSETGGRLDLEIDNTIGELIVRRDRGGF